MSDTDRDTRIAELEQRVRSLEAANESLLRTNQRLGRERLVAQDSAAASIAPRLEAAEAELERMRKSLSWRLSAPLRWPAAAGLWLYRRFRPALRALAVRLMR